MQISEVGMVGEAGQCRDGRAGRGWWVCGLGAVLCMLLGAAFPQASDARSSTGGMAGRAAEVRIASEVPPGLPAHWLPGRLPGAHERLTITVVLRRSRQVAFERYLASVEDRFSIAYHHFLSQGELTERFGPSAVAYRAIRRLLIRGGFERLVGSADRLTVSATGSLAAVQRAFDVRIRDYRVGSRVVYANQNDPRLPASLARSVMAVTGLSDLARPTQPAAAVPVASQSNLAITRFVCGLATTLPFTGTNLIAEIIKVFLKVAVVLNGTKGLLAVACIGFMGAVGGAAAACFGLVKVFGPHGFTNPECAELGIGGSVRERLRRIAHATAADPQKIGLLEFDSFYPSDVTDWLNLLGGGQSISDLSEVPVNGGVASPGAGESEVLVDIAAVMMLDPLLNTQYVVYEAPPSTSFAQLFQTMIGDGDTVISNSWSQCEDQTSQADADAIDSILAQAAASGISVFNATGDDGSTCLDGSPNTIGVPADSPNATAVGGSSPTPGPGISYGGSTWWNGASHTPATGMGGYGVSRYFTRPAYQNGLNSSSTRSVPDVVADADPAEGIQVCQADDGGCPSDLSFGGTSLAAPTWAAVVAVSNGLTGHNIGNPDSVLYPLAGTPALHSAASMGSDFAHVGLGSFQLLPLLQELSGGAGATSGPVSATGSSAVAAGPDPTGNAPTDVPADGLTTGVIQVSLMDADGNPVSGKTVTVTPNVGSTAVVSAASGPSDADGTVTFTVTDTTVEDVTFTVTDTTDNVHLSDQPVIGFVEPTATGAEISAVPTTVANDGSSMTTISVYLENTFGRPAAGKTVSLSDNGGSASITPASGQAVTDNDGIATFTATDGTEQSVAFTATDVTDGNLAVPGSATVTFQPGGSSSSCSDALPAPVGGYSFTPWATGLAYNPQALDIDGVDFYACSGIEQPAYDPSGNLFVPDAVSGEISVFGPAGGSAGTANALPDATFSPGQLGGLAFGKDGSLYAGLPITGGSFFSPEVVQLDPATGATERVVATSADGLQDCPYAMAVDPLSGDLFTTDQCTFGSDGLTRISDPASATPTVSTYTSLPYSGGLASAGIAFAPDGTIYVALPGSDEVVSVTGTNGPATPVVTEVASLPYTPYGVAVASTNAQGHATALYVSGSSSGTGTLSRVDLTAPLPNATAITSGSGDLGGLFLSPDGCVYEADLDQILQIATSGGCSTASAGPEIALSDSGPSPAPTGSSVTITAQLSDFATAAGTPVIFDVNGANTQQKLVNAGSNAEASFTLTGALTGGDSIQAFAENGSTPVDSAPLTQRWSTGEDVSSLTLNGSQESGAVGSPATFDVQLVDVSQSPPPPISGASVQVTLQGQSCTATTDSSGSGSCTITPPGPAALAAISASYAGDSGHTPSSASGSFAVGGLGLPAPVAPAPPGAPIATGTPTVTPVPPGAPALTAAPQITGKAKAGATLSCSQGSWSNAPVGFAYQWSRDGTPIAGATHATYKVQSTDEGLTLTCAVTATNAAGSSSPATTKGVLVPVPKVRGCPAATGRLSGQTLGLVKLGMTRAQARHEYRRSSNRGKRYQDFFCLTPIGVRVGYASPALLKTLARRERNKLQGRVVWTSTASAYYTLNGVRAGATVAAAGTRLKLGTEFHIGLNDWYLPSAGKATGVLKVRHGIIEEIGITYPQLAGTRKADLAFLKSFS